jgi:purine-cytosine permease-like protein
LFAVIKVAASAAINAIGGAAGNNYSFAGLPLLAAIVLVASYFAAGDANLYGAINAVENLRPTNRRRLVLLMMPGIALGAVLLSYYGNAFEVLASFNSIILPCVTLIIACEYFIVKKHWLGTAGGGTTLPALIALGCGWTVGILTAGVIHGTEIFHFGIWPLYAWLTSLSIYLFARSQCRSPDHQACIDAMPTSMRDVE